MNTPLRYVAALLPTVVTLGGWKLAAWAYPYAQCTQNGKGFYGCTIGSVDVTALLGFGMFWCQLLAWLAIPVSAWLLFSTWAKSRTAQSTNRL